MLQLTHYGLAGTVCACCVSRTGIGFDLLFTNEADVQHRIPRNPLYLA